VGVCGQGKKVDPIEEPLPREVIFLGKIKDFTEFGLRRSCGLSASRVRRK
jgi:hypothetical protein